MAGIEGSGPEIETPPYAQFVTETQKKLDDMMALLTRLATGDDQRRQEDQRRREEERKREEEERDRDRERDREDERDRTRDRERQSRRDRDRYRERDQSRDREAGSSSKSLPGKKWNRCCKRSGMTLESKREQILHIQHGWMRNHSRQN